MDAFIDKYGTAITLLITVLGFLVVVIISWDNISDRLRKLLKPFDPPPLLFFKLFAIAISGFFVGSLYWILVDYFTFGNLSFANILADIGSGAVWGIPVALFGGSRSKSIGNAMIWSIMIGVIVAIFIGPSNIIAPRESQSKIYALSLFWLITSISIASGYAGHRARIYIDDISPKV